MTEYLLVTMIKTLENNDLPEKSKQMLSTDREFTSNNDSAQDFVEEIGLHSIIGYSVTEVRKRYESWCELNSRIELKHKFNTTLESKFGLFRRKLGKGLINPDSENFGLIETGTIKQISGWMTAGTRDSYDFDKLDKDGNVEVQMGIVVGSSDENKTNLTELFGLADTSEDSIEIEEETAQDSTELQESTEEIEILNSDESESQTEYECKDDESTSESTEITVDESPPDESS